MSDKSETQGYINIPKPPHRYQQMIKKVQTWSIMPRVPFIEPPLPPEVNCQINNTM